MVTSIGKVTGDGSIHPVRCSRAGYQYDGSPRRSSQRGPEIP